MTELTIVWTPWFELLCIIVNIDNLETWKFIDRKKPQK